MINILFVHHCGILGGATVSLSNVIRALPRDRFRPAVLCPQGDATALFERAGAEVRIAPRVIHPFPHVSGGSRSVVHPAFVRRAFNQRRDRRFWTDYFRGSESDIIVLNSITIAPLALSAKQAGKKVVCCVRETAARGALGLRTAWLRRLLSTRMDAVCFLSRFDYIAAQCRAPIVEVIPNWVDFGEFDRQISREQTRRRLGLPVEARIMLFLGGISRIKGTLPLVQAMGHLRGVEGALLLVAGYAGSSPGVSRIPRGLCRVVQPLFAARYEKRVMRAIARNRLGDRIRFVGAVDRIAPLYAAADVVVFPATDMHQARPILEAGAMAKPVVVTDFTCYREFVANGVNGVTVAPGNIEALAIALRRILEDRQFGEEMGEANYRQALSKHNGTINAPEYVRLLDRVAGVQ